jgi:hypothetical protein
VQALYATTGLFSALKENGDVIIWGSAREEERDLHLVHHQLQQPAQ